MSNTKTCTECREELPATREYFHKNKNGEFGLHSKCKTCRNDRAWSKSDAGKEYMKQYQQDNRDTINKNNRIWRKKKMKENPEGIRIKNREYCKNHRENKIKKLGIEEFRKQNNTIATAYRESLPACIYGIQNKNNSKIYVGMTTRGITRWVQHKSALRNQKHHISSLQEDWNKHGEQAFVFEIIEELPCDTAKDELITKEEEYIKQYLNEGKVLYNTIRRTNV